MTLADLVMILIIGGFALYGLWFGFIWALGSLIGTVGGIYVAEKYYIALGNWIHSFTGGSISVIRLIAFILIVIIFSRLVGLVFMLVSRAFKFVAIIPFLKTINRFLGGILGFIEGAILVGLMVTLLKDVPVGTNVKQQVANSRVAQFSVGLVNRVAPYFEKAIHDADRLIPPR